MSEWNKKMLGWSYFEKIIVGFTRELGGRNDVVIETPELFHTVERHDLSDIRHPAMGSLGHSGGSLRGFRERLWLRGIEVKSPSGKQWVLGRISVTEFRRVCVLQTHTLTLNLLASSKMVFVWESPSEGFSSISPSSSCFFSSTGLSTGEAGLEICSAARALLRVLLLAATAAGGMAVEVILGVLEARGEHKWAFGEYDEIKQGGSERKDWAFVVLHPSFASGRHVTRCYNCILGPLCIHVIDELCWALVYFYCVSLFHSRSQSMTGWPKQLMVKLLPPTAQRAHSSKGAPGESSSETSTVSKVMPPPRLKASTIVSWSTLVSDNHWFQMNIKLILKQILPHLSLLPTTKIW